MMVDYTPDPKGPYTPDLPKQTKLHARTSQFTQSSVYKRWQERYKGKRLAPKFEYQRTIYDDYSGPSQRGETAQQMPYYSQLTPNERAIYEWLPGFSQSSVGKVLTKFGQGPFGKLLSVLDVGAEFVERAGGLASQYWSAKDNPEQLKRLNENIGAAWYAGSLAADMTNLPTYDFDNAGNIRGFRMPVDLPGAAGIAKARNDIISLVDQGMTHSEALRAVKEGYYDSLGALQLRAQLYDLYSHVLLDPLNVVLPALRPIERLRGASEFYNITKWADDVVDLNKVALTEAKAAKNMDDIVKIAGMTLGTVDRGSIARNIGRFADKLRLPRNTARRLFNQLSEAQKAGDIDKAADITEKLLDRVGLKWNEKFALYITGKQDPLNIPSSPFSRAAAWMDERVPINKYAPWRLTPEAKAQELVATVQDNVGAYIIAHFDDPYDVAEALRRAASGAVGPEMGHAFLTREGRAVQGILKGFDVETQKLIGAYDQIKDQRLMLAKIAETIGSTKEDVMGLLAKGDYNSVSRMTNGLASPEMLEGLYKSLENMPYSTKLFKLELMNKLADHTAHVGVTMFGIQGRGFAQKLAAAVKSAETLAFLRINPGYAVRNFLNNEFTIIGRGLGGVSMSEIEDLAKSLGFEPFRMSQGYGYIGDALGVSEDVGTKVIADAARGERGALDRFTDYVNNIKPFGRFDMGALSAQAEVSASRRAFVAGYLQGWNRYFWKPGKGFDSASQYFPGQVQDMINTVDNGFIPALDNAIGSAKTPEDIEKLVRGNLNLNMRSIMDEASKNLGYKVDEALPEEFIAKMEKGLNEAAQNGTIREYMTGLRDDLQKQLDELTKNRIDDIANDVAARVAAEGPAAFPKIWADEMNEWYGAAIQHAIETEEVTELIRLEKLADQPNWDRINQIWRNFEARTDDFYTRHWDRFDSTVQGMVKGAKNQGIPITDDVVANFKGIKRGWRGWWSKKRKLNNSYWDSIREGKTPPRTWDDIQEEISSTFDEMINLEDKLTDKIDLDVAKLLDDEEMQRRFLSWRGVANELRRQDKRAVQDFFENIKGMNSAERSEAWEEFWRLRLKRYESMVSIERMGETAMMDDVDAIQNLERAAEGVPATKKSVRLSEYYANNGSRTDFPQYVSDEIKREAERLRAELSGTGIELAEAEEAAFVGQKVRVSSNPMWYRDLFREGFKNKKSVTRALDKIIEGNDVARANETYLPKLKEIIMDNLSGTAEAPADPRFLLELGQDDMALDAFRQWMEGGFIGEMTDDDIVKMLGGEDNYNRLYALFNGEAPPPKAVEGAGQPFIPNKDRLNPPSNPDMAIASDTYWYTRGNQALDGIERAALDQAAKPPLKLSNLPDEAQDYLNNYINHVQGQMSDARYASIRFAEYRRDAALLNYNRRYNFDTFATMIFPYQFWFTHSAAMWMLHSVDRPAMLSTFLRIKEFMNTAGSPNQALPSRLKGAMRIPIPFLPDWMEDHLYFDPLRAALPFDTFLYPFEREMQRRQSLDGSIEYILSDMLEEGQITEAEYEDALVNPDNAYYLKAKEMAIADKEDLQFSAWDFANLISAPHAPLVWGIETARGTPENIGPFTPASRTIKGALGLMGVDWDRSPYNIEARVRKHLGLPAFDQWDDYRIDRMLSNMTAMGEITADQALRAMIDREGDAYDEAIRKSNIEFGISAMGSTLGIPAKAYPEGEYLQRSLYKGYQDAWAKVEETGNYDFINDFEELHPEIETRLALWKPPEERLKTFLEDNIWDIWNDLPKLTKDELKEQLEGFEEKFWDKDTRNMEAVTLEEMQTWLVLMGGDPPGTLEREPAPIDLADPEVAWRAQAFYETRWTYFPDWYDLQKEYYDIPEENKKARKAYRNANPMLVDYWDWRRDFFHRNPEVVPYLTDKDYEFKYSSPQAEQLAEQPQPWLTWDEWQELMGRNKANLIEDHFERGYDIPDVMQDPIEDLAAQLGISYSEAMDLMEESLALR
jgi:hypothetical protein